MPLIGYARVSTEDHPPLPQSQALKSAGCAEIFEEQGSGGNRARPVLARVLERIGKGDTLVVVRIDRLARSLSHLLEVIERLDAKGTFFRSLLDLIDTASPQGKFTLQVLGAAKAKAAIHNIWQAEIKDDAEKAFDLFIKIYEPKYPKAALCLQKDRDELMAFFDFPAQHWQST